MTYSDEFLKMKAEAIEHSIGKPRQAKKLPSGELLRDAIVRLRGDGKTFTAIKAELGCSLCTINYHLDNGAKEKSDMRKCRFVEKKQKAGTTKPKAKKEIPKKKEHLIPLPVDFKPKTDQQKKFKTKTVLPGAKIRVQVNHKTWIEVDPAKDVDKIVAKYQAALDHDRNFKHGRY